jgi:hypothetical protein
MTSLSILPTFVTTLVRIFLGLTMAMFATNGFTWGGTGHQVIASLPEVTPVN